MRYRPPPTTPSRLYSQKINEHRYHCIAPTKKAHILQGSSVSVKHKFKDGECLLFAQCQLSLRWEQLHQP